jgi:hypothetical protein
LGLREVALQPQLGKAVAEVLEDGGVGWWHEKYLYANNGIIAHYIKLNSQK